nr:MAG TPA: hypothetical protein [Inoviridae sp.]
MLKTITTEQKAHNILLNITTPLEFTTVKRYNNIEVKKMDILTTIFNNLLNLIIPIALIAWIADRIWIFYKGNKTTKQWFKDLNK